MTEALVALLREAVRRLRTVTPSEALLVHHNDADGVASAALLALGLEAAGCRVHRLGVEKIFPEVLAAIHARRAGLTVYADLAGQNTGRIAALADRATSTLILDHHRPEATQAPHVWMVNPELVGISGDTEASSSALAYQLARLLLPRAAHHADLAVLGALGDGQVVEGRLTGLNALALADAEAAGAIRSAAGASVQAAAFLRFEGRSGATLAAEITRLGAVGFYRDGPALAVAACRDGLDDEIRRALQGLADLEAERFVAEEARLRQGGLRQLGRAQWFDVGERFAPMGVKCVGTFCERLAAAAWVNPAAYVVGLQVLPREIPGLGRFDWDLRKVSVRVPGTLAAKVLAGRAPDLMRLVPLAAEAVGGFADGCHRLAAAATIPGNAGEAFAQAFARLAEGGGLP